MIRRVGLWLIGARLRCRLLGHDWSYMNIMGATWNGLGWVDVHSEVRRVCDRCGKSVPTKETP